MKVEYREILTQRYPIRCKFCLPQGEPDGVILGIHGFAGSKESSVLQALGEKVTGRGKALVCFDLPAHGDSPVEEDRFTVENCLQDLLFMADFCRREYPNANKYVFATSYGGFLTLLCSDRLADFRIVLRAPAVTMPRDLLKDVIGMTPEEYRAAGAVQCGFDRSLMLPYRFYEELQGYDAQSRSYEAEMLVIHGDSDRIVPHKDILRLCAGHPGMRLFVIPGADHRLSPEEAALAVNAAVEFWGI